MEEIKKKNNKLVIIIILSIIFILGIRYANLFEFNSNQDKFDFDDTINQNIDTPINKENLTYDDVSMLQYEEGTILERLNLLSKQDKRINEIIADYDKYPEKLLESLSRNVELTTFVLDYQKRKNTVYSNDIGSIDSQIPRLYQWDERWGYGSYGSSNIAISGCGPTALAMVVAGLKQDNTITPYKVAKLAEEKGYYVENSGTTWDLMRKGGVYYGLNVKELPLSESSIFNALEKGHPIICNMRKGDFTINGHYIVLVGIENGKIKVNDPNSKIRSEILWEFSRIKNQIKNLWEFYL